MTAAALYPARPGYPIEWRETEPGALRAFYVDSEKGRRVEATWAPLYGSQLAFLQAGAVFEVLYEGTRGPGKTDSLLMDFLQYVGRGWGAEWRGVLFRQTYPQLKDVETKALKWIPLLFPGARYNKNEHTWRFPTGEELLLRHMRVEDDYWNYHGHAYPWMGWEELTNWATDRCYTVMMSCCRSTRPGMPRCYRATTNPYGPGHNWVKARFRLPHFRGIVITDATKDGHPEPPRLAIHGRIHENLILHHADPDYINKIRAAARNPSELAAWLEGSWDIVAGGMFDDLWRGEVHVVPPFPLSMVPKGWKVDRSFDWGSSRPFAVGWWAESNGEPFEYGGRLYGRVRGDLYLIQEWYGWNGTRNEGVRMLARDVAEGILDREADWGIKGRVKAGPADSSIFDVENGNSIGGDMERKGVSWQAADKGPGSRKQGWEQMRKMLKGALTPRENPGLFIFSHCRQTIETLPVLPRDDKDLDDVDTEAEDHLADMIRYRVRKKLRGAKQTEM
jgi:hypothetical protein